MFKDKYITMYLNKEGTFIFLHLNAEHEFKCNINYTGTILVNDIVVYSFETPDSFSNDVKLIIEGKYSKISSKAKAQIIELSGLTYMKRNAAGTKDVTSAPLLALLKHPVYKASLEARIGVTLSDKDELIDKLTEECFIENLIK
jgi:hypothetical protein